MNLLVFVIAVAFVGALVWLIFNWNAKGPTDLWHDDDLTGTSPAIRVSTVARPDPHIDGPVVAIGYWAHGDMHDLPDPHAFVDPGWDPGERDEVVAFLEGGHAVSWWSPAPVACPFCEQPTEPGERSDGVYLWPEGLAHVLLVHQVRVPGVFVLHVRTARDDQRRHGAPDLSWLDHHPVPAVDETWWSTMKEL